MALKHFDPAEDSREATFLAYEFLRRQPQEGLTLTAAALAAQTTLSQVAAEHALLALSRWSPARVTLDRDSELVFAFQTINPPPKNRALDTVLFYVLMAVLTPSVLILSMPSLGLLHASTYWSPPISWLLVALGVVAIPFAMITCFGSLFGLAMVYLPVFAFTMIHLGWDAWDRHQALGSFVGFAAFGLVLLMFWGWQVREISKSEDSASNELLETLKDFLLGQRPSWRHDAKRSWQLLAWHRGTITIDDVMVGFGMNRAEAWSELTQLVLHYGGDIQISDTGAISFSFGTFKETKRPEKPPEPRPPTLFGHEGRWLQIAFWGTLFLGSITIITHPLYPAFPTNLEADFDTLMSRGAGLWPALFLGTLFVVRIKHWRVKLSEWQRRMVGVELLKQWRTTPQDHVLESEIPAQLLAEFGGTIDPEVSSTCVVFPEFERRVPANSSGQ